MIEQIRNVWSGHVGQVSANSLGFFLQVQANVVHQVMQCVWDEQSAPPVPLPPRLGRK
jgi:hypothetical protein